MDNHDVYISRKNWNKILDYAATAYQEWKTEIGGMAIVYKDKDDDYIIEEPVILKQEVTAGNTVLDQEALALYYVNTAMKHKDKRDLQFLWWHSHHTMGAFWSGTDTSTISEMSGSKSSFSLVVNLRGEYKLRVCVWDPLEAHKDIELQFIDGDKEILHTCKKKKVHNEVKALCEKPSVATVASNSYKRYINNNIALYNPNQSTIWGNWNKKKNDQEIKEYNEGFNINTETNIEDDPYDYAITKVEELIDKITDGSINYNKWKYAIKKLNEEYILASMPELQIKHMTEKEMIDTLGTLTAVDIIEFDHTYIPF